MNLSMAVRSLQRGANLCEGKDLSIRVHYWGADRKHVDTPLHKHSFFEICYVVDGSGLYFENGQDFLLEKGTFFCSRPNQLHKIYEGKNLYLLWAAFEIEKENTSREQQLLFEELANEQNVYLPNSENEPAVLLWKTLMKHAEQQSSSEVLKAISLSLMLSLQALFCGVRDHQKPRPFYDNKEQMIEKAQRFIQDNLAQPLSLNEVARFFHISPRHLSRLFSEITGMSYTSYVRQERVREASKKIRSTNRSITSIAYECGFTSVHYFCRVFLQETSITPAEYRRRNQV
ncbi:AraC family transcriptional regulator [Domibacillus sp. DTU_2020_1001157_1_SI_ALB_TIR_016]|uniref:AraC family transcriptional regulator n=1 Tax=Domibacillus sp. DTU_2020_1001157_1_SI_ALB_TIR_016 TaxID=3077789 RepID=UPI0028E8D6EF|nr:AraC family transcriptional regulator [Domibacillus sp. DTU_2020_1001157_1_SI_ALB_TIR_016]WNS77800.1 AraC family transcriptional regulator [Domibacillus sp. DTU_2020_1001157_1_SI_ALB_TIR_016]